MAKWTENEFIEKAKYVAHKFVTKQGSLNDLSEKVARDETLNPDEIRTLVRLANVATFQEMFATKQGDKMVEFEAGNPEAVISRIVDSVANPPQTANIHNDKFSHEEVPDMMVQKRLGHWYDEAEKVAEWQDIPERTPRRDIAIICARKHASEFEVESFRQSQVYEQKIAELVKTFRKAPGYAPDFSVLEKAAFSEFGEDARPELQEIIKDAKLAYELCPAARVPFLQAHYVSEDTKELELLKEAIDARHEFVKVGSAREELKKLVPEL